MRRREGERAGIRGQRWGGGGQWAYAVQRYVASSGRVRVGPTLKTSNCRHPGSLRLPMASTIIASKNSSSRAGSIVSVTTMTKGSVACVGEGTCAVTHAVSARTHARTPHWEARAAAALASQLDQYNDAFQ